MMRKTLLVAALLSGCAMAPREGTLEWVVTRYTKAMLSSNTFEMRAYLAEGAGIDVGPQDPAAPSRQPIKICQQSGSEGDTRRAVLVLIAGQPGAAIQGVDVIAVKEEKGWRIKDARLAVDADGAPRTFLRNCAAEPKSGQ
jgi:hypothetical protein